jgi:hypothetical protein
MINQIMEHTKIEFQKLSQPLHSYKIHKTTEYKKNTRVVGLKYLLAQVREGVFDD